MQRKSPFYPSVHNQLYSFPCHFVSKLKTEGEDKVSPRTMLKTRDSIPYQRTIAEGAPPAVMRFSRPVLKIRDAISSLTGSANAEIFDARTNIVFHSLPLSSPLQVRNNLIPIFLRQEAHQLHRELLTLCETEDIFTLSFRNALRA